MVNEKIITGVYDLYFSLPVIKTSKYKSDTFCECHVKIIITEEIYHFNMENENI